VDVAKILVVQWRFLILPIFVVRQKKQKRKKRKRNEMEVVITTEVACIILKVPHIT
jgi:hypothetical protein